MHSDQATRVNMLKDQAERERFMLMIADHIDQDELEGISLRILGMKTALVSVPEAAL